MNIRKPASMASVKSNFIYQSIYQVLVIILPLITTPYISRTLGQEGVGVYAYTNTIVYFFLMAANLGISNYGNREIGAVSSDRNKLSITFWGMYWCHAIVSVLCIIGYVLFILLFNHSYGIELICQIFQLIAALLDITWLFFGVQNFKATVWKNIAVRLITVALIFLLVKESNDVWKYILIMSLGTFVGQAVMWTQVRMYVDYVHVNIHEIVHHLKPLVILFVPIIGISFYRYMDKAMIPVFSTISQLGLYESSEKIMTIPLSFITSFGIVLLPKISGLVAAGNAQKSIHYFEKAIKYELLLAFAMVFGLIGIAPVLAPVFLGPEFIECSGLISGIAITLLFITWSNAIKSQYLIPNKMDRAFIVATFVGAIINFGLNMVLIPVLNAMGAVIATVITEFIVAVIHTLYSYKKIDFKPIIKSNIFFLIPGIMMVVIVRQMGQTMPTSWGTLGLQIGVGAAVYLLISLSYLFMSKDEIIVSAIKKFNSRKQR